MNLQRLVIYCVDVGNVKKGHLGWARLDRGAPVIAPVTGDHLPDLVLRVASDLDAGLPVALGFEAPLFIPLGRAEDWLRLNRRRAGEYRGKKRIYPWSAGAGRVAMFEALPLLPWLLDAVRQRLAQPRQGYADWRSFVAADAGLVVWEAFVTGPVQRDRHDHRPLDDMRDAAAGALALHDRLSAADIPASDISEDHTHSFAGAALLRTGWTTDLSVLSQQCLVVWTTKPPRLLADLPAGTV